MNGTYKCSRNYRSLALSVLGCIGLAAFTVPALAQGAGGKGVSVTVNPTTGYAVINSSTVSTPRGTTVGPSGGPPSVITRTGGGLSQTLPAGIEITGLRQNAQTLRGPLGATLNAGLGALKNGAVRCMTSFRCTSLLGLGSIGLQALLDTVDWTLDENGRPVVTERSQGQGETEGSGWLVLGPYHQNVYHESPDAACGFYAVHANRPPAFAFQHDGRWVCGQDDPAPPFFWGEASFFGSDLECPSGFENIDNICFSPPVITPVPAHEISDAVDQHYTPDPSDWNWLTGGLNFSDPDVTIDITDIPVLDGSNEPNFIEWSDGTSRGTFNTYTPTVTNNGSHKPEISVKDEQTEISYDNQGNPTGSSTSTTVTPPSTSTGGGGAPAAEVPTDCDFMPTVCRFIDWFTEPEPLPEPDQEIRDLVQVYEDGGRSVDLGPSTGTCPAPRVIALSFVPAVEVSFQPFCDLAAAVRFWLLAIAYFGAAYLTVRSI